jgi:hypothetical protein
MMARAKEEEAAAWYRYHVHYRRQGAFAFGGVPRSDPKRQPVCMVSDAGATVDQHEAAWIQTSVPEGGKAEVLVFSRAP